MSRFCQVKSFRYLLFFWCDLFKLGPDTCRVHWQMSLLASFICCESNTASQIWETKPCTEATSAWETCYLSDMSSGHSPMRAFAMFALRPISPGFGDSKQMFNPTLMKIRKLGRMWGLHQMGSRRVGDPPPPSVQLQGHGWGDLLHTSLHVFLQMLAMSVSLNHRRAKFKICQVLSECFFSDLEPFSPSFSRMMEVATIVPVSRACFFRGIKANKKRYFWIFKQLNTSQCMKTTSN